MDCALTKRRRSCISLPHLSTSRSSLINLRCLLRVISSGSLLLHREMSRWTWLDRCSARRSQSGWLLRGGKDMPRQPLGVQVQQGVRTQSACYLVGLGGDEEAGAVMLGA